MNSGRQAFADDDLALDLGGLLRAVGFAQTWLLPLTIVVAVVVFLMLQMIAPKYLGEARVIIESGEINIPGSPRGIEEERALLDSEGVASQVQLLMSTDLARRVANKLDLASVPEFGASENNSLIKSLLSFVGIGGSQSANSAEERVLKHYYENLDVYRLEGSRVIAVDYSSEDPLLSAEVANTVVDQYLAVQSSAKRETTELTSAALEPQIVELRREVQAARQAVADFRARADLLIGTDNIPLNQQQLGEISSEYSAAQAAKAEAQAKADLIRELLNSGGSLETASDVLNSLLIQRLRERQVELQSNIAELSITLLPSHPQLKALQSQLNDYDRQIRSEARKILQGLENDAKVANQRSRALEQRLEELKEAAARSNADQARLSELEREANAKATQLDQLLLSFREADSRLRAQVLPADARIVSRANVPVEPYSPKVIAGTIIAALVTFILGCTFVIMRELLKGAVLQPIGHPSTRRGEPAMKSAPPSQNTTGSFTWGPSFSETYQNVSITPANKWAETVDAAGEAKESVGEILEESAVGKEPEGNETPLANEPKAEKASWLGRLKNAYDRNVTPEWVSEARTVTEDVAPSDEPIALNLRPAANDIEPDNQSASDIDVRGKIVVLSVDDQELSHELAFDLARRAAADGRNAIFMEIFPEQSNIRGAEGFSDVVAGKAPFAKAVYRDAGSAAHIIEAGRYQITDDMVHSDRFRSALEAIGSTYDTIVVDLGAIDGTLASARMLSFADRVMIAASAPDHSHELESAANLLAHNTGANVEIVIAEDSGPGPRRNGDGHAA